jgi:hypothetical protein
MEHGCFHPWVDANYRKAVERMLGIPFQIIYGAGAMIVIVIIMHLPRIVASIIIAWMIFRGKKIKKDWKVFIELLLGKNKGSEASSIKDTMDDLKELFRKLKS